MNLTQDFGTSESEREITLEGSWFDNQGIQTGADCNADQVLTDA
jgi:hypothetical protein